MNQPPKKYDIWFRDVTGDSKSCQAADRVPELRSGYEKLGFRRVGFLGEYQTPGGTLSVHEVLSSANDSTFLTLTLAPDYPLIKSEPRTFPNAVLESALEDGSIIITTTYRERLWRLNHPKAGLFLESSSEATPEELWSLHQRRVEEVVARRGSSLLRHNSMSLRLWIEERCNEVGNYVALFALCVGLAAFVEGMALLIRLGDWLNAWGRAWLGAFFLPFWFVVLISIAVAVLWLIRSEVVRGWRVGQWFARQFPWPRRRRYDPMKTWNGS